MTGTTFTEKSAELRRKIGDTITGHVVVDQVYAHYQHEDLSLHHPRGGRAKYLQSPLYEHYRDYLQVYAEEVLGNGGQRAVEHAMEHLSDAVVSEAPHEWGDLMESGHPSVTVGERTIYDRPPHVGRLSAEELRVKSQATLRARLAAGLTVYFTRHGKVHVIPGKNDPHALRGRL